MLTITTSDIIVYTAASLLIFLLIGMLLPGRPEDTSLQKGRHFEDWSAKYLSGLTGKSVYRNLVISRGNGQTAEIDIAFMSSRGLFCVECKTRKASVTGTFPEDDWTVCTRGGTFPLRDPVKQNYCHIRALRAFLSRHGIKDVPIRNLVYIECDALNYSGPQSDDILVTDWYGRIRKWYIGLPEVCDPATVRAIDSLLESAQADPETIQNHIENIRRRYSA
jgi:hypothetical protein